MRKVFFLTLMHPFDQARTNRSSTPIIPLTPASVPFCKASGMPQHLGRICYYCLSIIFLLLVTLSIWQVIEIFMCASNRRFPLEIHFIKGRKRRAI